jgi:peptidoglycan/LPS O-acetylase OafA/YrhL
MVNEWQRTERVDMRRFYERRIRRLMPAALIVLAGVSFLSWLIPDGTRPLSFMDIFSGATYWENLHLIASGSNYEEINGIASPVLHMWSLSLEEQVYIVFPLIMIGLLSVASIRRRAGTLLVLLATGGFLLGPILKAHYDTSVAYYATPVRAAEFLGGAALAVFWGHSRHTDSIIRFLRTRPMMLVGFLVFAAEALLWWRVGLQTTALFPWAVAASTLCTCGIMAYAEAGGPLSDFLSFGAFRWLGIRVYGLYLVHWPVFRFINGRHLDLSSFWLFVVRMIVTFAISESIFRLIEDPVRRGKLWKGRRIAYYCVPLFIVALTFGVLGNKYKGDKIVDTDYIKLQQEQLLSIPVNGATAPTNSAIDPNLPARVLLVGDSQSFSVGAGMQQWGQDHGVEVRFDPGVGCGIGGVTPIKYLGIEKKEQEGCAAWAQVRPEIVKRYNPQLVVIVGGLGDLSDRKLDDGKWHHIGEPVYDDWLRSEMKAFVDEMTASGAEVLWFSHPDVKVPYQAGATGQPPFKENDPERMAQYNAMIKALAEEDPRVTFADFAAQVRAHPGGQFDKDLRPDGTHIDMKQAPELVTWVAQQIHDVSAG